MNCPDCGEEIHEFESTRECEYCMAKMHKSCGRDIRDPLDEMMQLVQAELPPENPRTTCLTCYEARAYAVRMCDIGCDAMNHPDLTCRYVSSMSINEWKHTYGRIIDAWPLEASINE